MQMVPRFQSVVAEEAIGVAMGLGFGARGVTMQVENGDGGRDSVVNLFSTWKAKERHLIFGACWQDCSAHCEIKFSGHVGLTARCTGAVLSRDWNLFHILIGNDYDKMLLT